MPQYFLQTHAPWQCATLRRRRAAALIGLSRPVFDEGLFRLIAFSRIVFSESEHLECLSDCTD
jgi:hypothetical protein